MLRRFAKHVLNTINPTGWIMLDDHATAMSNETNIKHNIVGSIVGWNVDFV